MVRADQADQAEFSCFRFSGDLAFLAPRSHPIALITPDYKPNTFISFINTHLKAV